MLDTVGPELQVVNSAETPISLEENGTVVLTPHKGQEASNSLLPINFSGLAKVLVSAISHGSECGVFTCISVSEHLQADHSPGCHHEIIWF
jgi:hypothetical protein